MTGQQNKTLSANIGSAINDTMEAIKDLGNVYAEETAALKKTDTNKFMALQSRKVEAAHNYQDVMTQMISRKNELAKIDPATKERLRKLHSNFVDLSNKNLDALERMKRCTDRLGNTIRNAVVKSARQQQTFSYGESGQISSASRRKAISAGLYETA